MLKKSKAIVAILLVLLVCFGSVTSAFANQPIVAPDEDNPVTLTITKTLRLPGGTITPNATFRFTSELVSVDGNGSEGVLALYNELRLATLAVSFTTADTGSNNPDNNITSIVKQTGNIFAGVTFPHAGIYVFEIAEERNTNPAIDNNAPHEVLIYSEDVFRITVYVANTTVGTRTFVSAVGIFAAEEDEDGELVVGDKTGQIAFVNDFVRTNGAEDPEDPDPVTESTLYVSKQVAGDLASRTQYFDYTMTLAIPELVRDIPDYFRAYVVEGGKVIDPVNNVNPASDLIGTDAGGSYIKIATTGETAFQLRDGQRLVFVDTPVGTRYTVREAAAANYVPSFIVTRNNVAENPVIGTMNTALFTGTQFVGELLNRTAFTNTRDFVAPTGLGMNDLPFIGLMLLALGALVAFVVVKVRRRRYH